MSGVQWLTLGVCAWIWYEQKPYWPKLLLAWVAIVGAGTSVLAGWLW